MFPWLVRLADCRAMERNTRLLSVREVRDELLGLLQEIATVDCFPALEPEVCSQGVGGATLPPEALGEGPSCLFQVLGAPGVLGLWPHPSNLCLCLHMASH